VEPYDDLQAHHRAQGIDLAQQAAARLAVDPNASVQVTFSQALSWSKSPELLYLIIKSLTTAGRPQEGLDLLRPYYKDANSNTALRVAILDAAVAASDPTLTQWMLSRLRVHGDQSAIPAVSRATTALAHMAAAEAPNSALTFNYPGHVEAPRDTRTVPYQCSPLSSGQPAKHPASPQRFYSRAWFRISLAAVIVAAGVISIVYTHSSTTPQTAALPSSHTAPPAPATLTFQPTNPQPVSFGANKVQLTLQKVITNPTPPPQVNAAYGPFIAFLVTIHNTSTAPVDLNTLGITVTAGGTSANNVEGPPVGLPGLNLDAIVPPGSSQTGWVMASVPALITASGVPTLSPAGPITAVTFSGVAVTSGTTTATWSLSS